MNYPRLFERCYLRPVAVTRPAFSSIHQVLRPRLLGTAVMPDKLPEKLARKPRAANGRQDRPEPTYAADGRVIDARMYGLAAPGVAVVPVKGILARNVSILEAIYCGMCGYEPIMDAVRQADAADEVETIILDIDSPGGECNGCDELANLILSVSKPVYSFTDGMACSAAYQLACSGEEIYCTASAMLGSIGVICAVLDDTQANTDEGIKMEYFTAGEHKAIGYSGYQLSDADRANLQGMVDYNYQMFADAVRESRGDIAPLVNKSAEIYTGQQAVDAGLADAVVSGFDELVGLLQAPA